MSKDITLTDEETFKAIKEHSLSIRRIPCKVTSFYSYNKNREGLFESSELVEKEVSDGLGNSFEDKVKFVKNHIKRAGDTGFYRIDYENEKVFRRLLKSVRIPSKAGHWMVQPYSDTSAMKSWDYKTNFVAPMLNESVANYLKDRKETCCDY